MEISIFNTWLQNIEHVISFSKWWNIQLFKDHTGFLKCILNNDNLIIRFYLLVTIISLK